VTQLRLLVMFGIAGLAVAQVQQNHDPETVCPIRTAAYPVGVRTLTLREDQRPRFEIRTCGSGDAQEIQLLGYSERQSQPILLINTGAKRLELLIQTENVLIVQAEDGVSSSALYIAQFQNGKPLLVAKDRTVGGVSYSEDHQGTGDYVMITVPLKVYRDGTTKQSDVAPHRYRLRVDAN
jgi:hypothetical protein